MGWTSLHKESDVSIKSFFETQFALMKYLGARLLTKLRTLLSSLSIKLK